MSTHRHMTGEIDIATIRCHASGPRKPPWGKICGNTFIGTVDTTMDQILTDRKTRVTFSYCWVMLSFHARINQTDRSVLLAILFALNRSLFKQIM